MCGISKRGFTLIEILVVIALMVLLGAIVVPNLMRRQPLYARDLFVRQLNTLTRLAWQRALVTGRVHKIIFTMSSRTVSVQAESEKKDAQGNALFEPLKGAYVRSSYTWPSNLVIHHFYIEGVDEMTRRKAGAGSIWFFVMPEGLAQSVIINLVDTKNKVHKKPLAIGLVLNPFAAQFDRYDIFQKP